MNILFLTLAPVNSVNERGLYSDMIRQFIKKGHEVYVVCPVERRYKTSTYIKTESGCKILFVKTLNIQKTNIIEKGLGTIAIEYQYLAAINKYWGKVKFDLLLYSTPPITFTKIISKIRQRDNSQTYLLLKDIFPQNAVDIGLMSDKSLVYKFFRRKEKLLYDMSDYIGCMSPANVEYIISHNPQIEINRIEVCPNSIELPEQEAIVDKVGIRKKYSIPSNSTIFVYGGNLGKPQGLDFLLEVLYSNKDKTDRFFIIVGSGTELEKISSWFNINTPVNSLFINTLPKQEYDQLVQVCDVGMIFLDPRFTIPNYPSRLLSYMEYKMPVLLATDLNTDIGKIAETNDYGFWCVNGDLHKFNSFVDLLCSSEEVRIQMGERAYKYLCSNYTVNNTVDIVLNHFK